MRLNTIAAVFPLIAGCTTTTVHDEASVAPGINERWTDPALDVEEAAAIFEAESRELYAARHAIVSALGLRAGARVADVGAGTGFFSFLFADAVGESGRVYAVELSPVFVQHLRESVQEHELSQVEVVQCTERSCELLPASVEAVFLCDTYHHLEYPRASLASIRQALRRGGELWIVDFEREEGVSREWVLEHVRCGSEVVSAELAEAGFEPLGLVEVPGLTENYVLRARRP